MRILPLTYGWEDLPKSISVHGADPNIRLLEPVPGVLVEVDGGWFLLDTGFNPSLVRDRHLRRRFHSYGVEPVLVPGVDDPLEAAFARVGVDPGDVVAVGLSHLHNDHAGGLRWFAGHVPIYCQRAELEFGLSAHPKPERHGIFRVDFDDPTIDWRLSDGDDELAPGLSCVATYGHTPGHQSFVVKTGDGSGFVFAFDAADLQENIDDELAVGGFVDCEPDQTVEAIRRLKAIAAETGYRLVPGHDPHAWPALEMELGLTPPVP
jgi:glyoxylase-like metal-dependent hydrolase (beta-lactamase superfamily II)